MAKFNAGYKNIEVTLIDFPNDISSKGTTFNEFGSENYEIPMVSKKEFIDTFLNGKTFPKYILEGLRVGFEIKGISRICLAQLTRDNAIFCSESHGLRPLSMEFNIPLNIYNDESIMNKLKQAQSLLEEAYIEACEKELPYPETRYLGLHSQTISVNASYTLTAFVKACYSRTNNSFCDELNYVYRKMYHCLSKRIDELNSILDMKIWKSIINEKSCIDDNYYTRTAVFNGDFDCGWNNRKPNKPAHNDWRKSGWKIELERIYEEEPWLLTNLEKDIIEDWMEQDKHSFENPTSYDDTQFRVAKNAIKTMDYYKEHKYD